MSTTSARSLDRSGNAKPEPLIPFLSAVLQAPPAKQAFDRLTRLASQLLRAPAALVSMLHPKGQTIISAVGLSEPRGAPGDWPVLKSICQRVLASRNPLIVVDAAHDPSMSGNLLIGTQQAIACLVLPLLTSDGQVLGVCCVLDTKPRPWDDDLVTLRDLCAFVMDGIEGQIAIQDLKGRLEVTEQQSREKGILLDATGAGVFSVDLEIRCTSINRIAAHLLGYRPEEVLGRPMHALIHHHRVDGTPYPEEECPIVRAVRSGREIQLNEEMLWRHDGSSFPAQYSALPLREGGVVTGAVITFKDITERKWAEEALARDALLLSSVQDSVIVTDPEGIIVYWNEGATRLYGWERSEMLGRPLADRFPEPARLWITNQIQSLVGGARWDGEWEDYRKDGSRVWIHARVRAIKDVSGKTVGVIGIAHDISDRKGVEKALREAETRFRTVIEQAPFSIQIVTPDGLTRLVNPAFEELWGISKEVLADYNLLQDPQLEARGILPEIRRAFEGESVTLLPVLYDPAENGKPGRARWTEATVYPVHDETRSVREVVLMHRDVTERRVAEEERDRLLVREQHARAEAEALAAEQAVILKEMVDGVIIADAEGRITFVNEAAQRIHGVAELGVPIERYSETYHLLTMDGQPYPPEEVPLARAVREGETVVDAHWRIRRPDGAEVVAQGSATPLIAEDGTRLGAVLLLRDTTAQRTLERQKDELLAELAATDRRKHEFLAMLAHELRNPLAPIRNAVELLQATEPDTLRLQRTRAVIQRQVQQLSRLVDDLLDVSRITRGTITLREEVVDLSAVLHHAVQTSRPVLDAGQHELSVSLPTESIHLTGDPTRLEQVITNLLNNAAKYTPPGGHISLTAQREQDQAVIRVRDTGIGIAPELLPRIFDLFVQAERTPDRAQGGLGIGLTLVRRLVEYHGGQVEAHSEGPGKGSEFIVRLPLLPEGTSGTSEIVRGRNQQAARGLRVLVVDDNVDAADTLSEVLAMWGHEIRVAHDGLTALEVAEECQPEVILLDIGLPGMDGYEVARRLRQEHGRAKPLLLALTGYGQVEDRRRSENAGFDHHLVKPVDLGELQRLMLEATRV